MNVLVRYSEGWGLGDLLCSDPMIHGLIERFGPSTRVWVEGDAGNVLHNPEVAGPAPPGLRADHVVDVKLFSAMPLEDYARLEAMDSLIDHMCSYAGVRPSDRRPRLHLTATERDTAAVRALAATPWPRIAICADHFDPLRHWPPERWREVALELQAAGATIVGVGLRHRLGTGIDQVGRLSMRETAAVLEQCDLFLGNNSAPFHYAQAAGTACVTLFSLARPSRFIHPGAAVTPVQARHLPCIDCMTRCFAAMVRQGCIAAPRGRCMLEIEVVDVLEAAASALEATRPAPGIR